MDNYTANLTLNEFELDIILKLIKAEHKRVSELPRHADTDYFTNRRLYTLGTATGKVFKAYDRTQIDRTINEERYADWVQDREDDSEEDE